MALTAMTEENIIELLDHLVKSPNTRPTHHEALEIILSWAEERAEKERLEFNAAWSLLFDRAKPIPPEIIAKRGWTTAEWRQAVLARIGWKES